MILFVSIRHMPAKFSGLIYLPEPLAINQNYLFNFYEIRIIRNINKFR